MAQLLRKNRPLDGPELDPGQPLKPAVLRNSHVLVRYARDQGTDDNDHSGRLSFPEDVEIPDIAEDLQASGR